MVNPPTTLAVHVTSRINTEICIYIYVYIRIHIYKCMRTRILALQVGGLLSWAGWVGLLLGEEIRSFKAIGDMQLELKTFMLRLPRPKPFHP